MEHRTLLHLNRKRRRRRSAGPGPLFFGPRDPYSYDRYLKKRCGGEKTEDYLVHDHGGLDVYDPHDPVIGKWQVSQPKLDSIQHVTKQTMDTIRTTSSTTTSPPRPTLPFPRSRCTGTALTISTRSMSEGRRWNGRDSFQLFVGVFDSCLV